jgi:long-chain acyl-CoA synthetase
LRQPAGGGFASIWPCGIAAANQRLARVQQVKRWHLLPVEWTAETEELTPTLKLKRRVVHAKYADIIDSLYTG